MGRVWNPFPRRIALFRALKLGDMLCAVPALRAIRSGFPGAEIVLIGLPWAREFADRYSMFLDSFMEFPGFPGLPEQEPNAERAAAFFEAMRAERFDLAIQLHGAGEISNQVTAKLGARVSAGFYQWGSVCPDRATFLPYPDRGLELRRLLSLVEHLGIPSRGEALEFPIEEQDEIHADRLLAAHEVCPREYICVHGGASVAERRWPLERFAEVADELSGRGLKVLLTGSASEKGLTRTIARAMRRPTIDLAGQTPLGVLGAVLRGACLLVCNDTGVSHLADALAVPSVVISTGDNPERWAPPDASLHRVLCRDSGVSVDEVVTAARALLGRVAGSPRAGCSGALAACEADDSSNHPGSFVEACDHCAS